MNDAPIDVSDEDTEDSPDKPLMWLFKRLLYNDNKNYTVVTNSQIVNILQKEFSMDTSHLHELEVDIYLNVMKKFLKDWPLWDEFDHIIHDMKARKDERGIKDLLFRQYTHLKSYLTEKLDIVRPLAQEKVQSIKKTEEAMPRDGEEFLDVVLEVHCKRSILYSLFHRYPQPNADIFNLDEAGPSKICLETMEFRDLFRWWKVGIKISCKALSLKWMTMHECKHVLVNKKLKYERKILPNFLGFQAQHCHGRTFNKKTLAALIENFSKYSSLQFSPKNTVSLLMDIIMEDLNLMPEQLEVPCNYRRNWTKYPYVRYMYKDSDTPSDKYDLQLEETITPRSLMQLHVFNVLSSHAFSAQSLTVFCGVCNVNFNTNMMVECLKEHIINKHMNEPDWQCTNCKDTFSMLRLAKTRWQHVCKKKD